MDTLEISSFALISIHNRRIIKGDEKFSFHSLLQQKVSLLVDRTKDKKIDVLNIFL